MSLVLLRIYKHLRASRKLARGQRAAASRMMQEDAELISGSRAAIDDSRALLNRVDLRMEGAPHAHAVAPDARLRVTRR